MSNMLNDVQNVVPSLTKPADESLYDRVYHEAIRKFSFANKTGAKVNEHLAKQYADKRYAQLGGKWISENDNGNKIMLCENHTSTKPQIALTENYT